MRNNYRGVRIPGNCFNVVLCRPCSRFEITIQREGSEKPEKCKRSNKHATRQIKELKGENTFTRFDTD